LRLAESLVSSTSAGVQYYKTQRSLRSVFGEIFPTPTVTTVGSAARTEASENFVENATLGTYVQQQFEWRNRVFLTAAVRMDDNSAFGTDFDAAVYPKVGATWVLHEEPFWGLEFMDQFRIRAAFGAAGRQPNVLDASQTYSPSTGPGNQPILLPATFGNEKLAPERGEEVEYGFEAGFWQGRLGFNFTGYNRWTRDALVSKPLPPSAGFPGSQMVNLGEIKGWGTEMELNVVAVDRPSLVWDLNFNVSTQHNEIVDMGEEQSFPTARNSHVEGYPINSYFQYEIVSADFVS
jgi:outer membrane receptor protein involved in Fe transport